MGIFEFPYAYVAVQQEAGKRKVVMCNDGKIIETPVPHLSQTKIRIRARATDKDFTARFYYSLDGKTFHPVGNVLNMGLGLPWTANRFALFNFSTTDEGVGGIADFNYFRVLRKLTVHAFPRGVAQQILRKNEKSRHGRAYFQSYMSMSSE